MICPKCKMEIDCIDYDVSASCSSSLYEDDKDSYMAYDMDSLMSNVCFSNFRCPECEFKFTDDRKVAESMIKTIEVQ